MQANKKHAGDQSAAGHKGGNGSAEKDSGSIALLSAESIRVTRSGKHLLNEVSVQVRAGELVGLIGPNGAGKSTLLSVMAGLLAADHGQVHFRDKPLKDLSSNERAKQIGWMEQMATAHWPVSVEHLVMLGRIPYLSRWQTPSPNDIKAVDDALSATDCQAFREQKVTTLSGGELTRVMLSRVLATKPSVLLADEPVAALDIGHQLQTMDMLRDYARGSQAAVVVMHDLSLAARYCDKLFLLHNGELAVSGGVASVLSTQNIKTVYGVNVLTGCDEVPWIVPVSLSGD